MTELSPKPLKGKKQDNVTIVHSYEDRPTHMQDATKYPDPNEIVPRSKAPGLDTRKKIFPCGNRKCKHDSREHAAVPNPSIGNTAGACNHKGCKCHKYKFTGEVKYGPKPRSKPWRSEAMEKLKRRKRALTHGKFGVTAVKKRVGTKNYPGSKKGIRKRLAIKGMLIKGKGFKEIEEKLHVGSHLIHAVKKAKDPRHAVVKKYVRKKNLAPKIEKKSKPRLRKRIKLNSD